MKLYYTKAACSLVVRIIINEIGLPCQYEAVDLKTKKTENDMDFFAINPKGSVPVLEIKPHEVLTENAVILQYLADSNHAEQLLAKVGDFKRYRILEWLNFITTELHKGFSPLFNPSLAQDVKESIIIPNLNKKFTFVNEHLKSNQFLAADHFTLPDAYLYVIIRWANGMNFNVKQWPNIVRYFGEVQNRQSILTSLEQEGLEVKEIA